MVTNAPNCRLGMFPLPGEGLRAMLITLTSLTANKPSGSPGIRTHPVFQPGVGSVVCQSLTHFPGCCWVHLAMRKPGSELCPSPKTCQCKKKEMAVLTKLCLVEESSVLVNNTSKPNGGWGECLNSLHETPETSSGINLCFCCNSAHSRGCHGLGKFRFRWLF